METMLKDRVMGEMILKKTTQTMAQPPWPPKRKTDGEWKTACRYLLSQEGLTMSIQERAPPEHLSQHFNEACSENVAEFQ